MPDYRTRLQAAKQAAILNARTDLLAFMRYCWWGGRNKPFLIGRHTQLICDRITRAIDDYENGIDTNLIIITPPRHGKSDIVSRALPSFFLGRCGYRDPDVIMSTYALSLVEGFSEDNHQLIESQRYQEVFPNTRLGTQRRDKWGIEGRRGIVTAQGIGGSTTGKGGDLIVVDDYVKDAQDAASEAKRNTAWDWFQTVISTRRAPVSILILCCTAWHVDDLRGRIYQQMEKDPKFPQFETLLLPARNEDPEDGWKYLFPERFSADYYDSQRAVLGEHWAAAILDGIPVLRGGNRFDVTKIKYHHDLSEWKQLKEHRGWDLASSTKERDKGDPDRTWGVRGAVEEVKNEHDMTQYNLWISSLDMIQAEAPGRNAFILDVVRRDGGAVSQHIEAFGGYKDTYTAFRDLLKGVCRVRKSQLPGDKTAKLTPLEPIFDAGNVNIYMPGCEKHLDMWLKEFKEFPAGTHDDACDATVIMFEAARKKGGSEII